MGAKGQKPVGGKSTGSGGFVTWFRHYRTGQILYAANYGYRAWPFGKRK